MNNYGKLIELEKELAFIKAGNVEDDVLFLENLDIHYSLYVVNVHTGEKGYVRSYGQDTALFIVPATGAEREITIKDLNDLYIETPKHLLGMTLDNPKFVVCPNDLKTGVVIDEIGGSVVVDWGDKREQIKNKDIYWMSPIAGIKKIKKC